MNLLGDDQAPPTDLVLVLLMTSLMVIVSVTPALRDSVVRIPVGGVFVFFVPGYVLTAALFPRASEATVQDDEVYLGPLDRNFSALERMAVSIGLSIAIVSLLALSIDASSWPLSLGSILVSVCGFVIVTVAFAAWRRRRLPPKNRLKTISRSQLNSIWKEMWGSRTDQLVNVLLAISVVLVSLSVAYAVTVPRQDQQFTRFYILSENGEGEFVADGYPVNLAPDESGRVVVGIDNYEHERLNYSVVVLFQRINRDGDAVRVVSEERLTSFSTDLSHGEAERQQVTFSPSNPDDEFRVSFLLFRDNVPDEPNPDNSYRHLHLLVNRKDER